MPSAKNDKDLVILGIDPGTAVTGYGLVRRSGNRLAALDCGAWRSRSGDSLADRLAALTERAREDYIQRMRPNAVALEEAFFGKNVQSALRLGEARGALLALCGRLNVDVVEYSTAAAKKAVTGSGRADKTQVQFMLQKLLKLPAPPSPLDASDALALAYALANDFAWRQRAENAARGKSSTS